MNDILSGTYKGNTYRIKVECYPNTPAIKVQLLPVNAGERITMTQNLGQPLPRYQAFLCEWDAGGRQHRLHGLYGGK